MGKKQEKNHETRQKILQKPQVQLIGLMDLRLL